MKTDCGIRYYSSLPNEAPESGKAAATLTRRKNVYQSPSPRQTIENASSSISNAVVTSVNSARKMKDKACSLVPKKSCKVIKRGELDEVTPVIFYPDKDTVTKQDGPMTFVDPYSFEDSELPDVGKDARSDSNSPTSVVPARLLFPQRSNGDFAFAAVKDSRKEENNVINEVVSFDCPVFSHDFNFGEGEDISIEVSEAIKSINDQRSVEGTKSFRESIRAKKAATCESPEAWEDASLPPWDGFMRSSSFTMCEWDPKANQA